MCTPKEFGGAMFGGGLLLQNELFMNSHDAITDTGNKPNKNMHDRRNRKQVMVGVVWSTHLLGNL